MRVFIDDIRAPWDDWVLARTITEAIRILATLPVEIVSLDHDIACRLVGGQEHSSNESFEAVARYIALMPKEIRPKVQFHTGNPDGGIKMAQILGISYNWVDAGA